MAPVSASLHVVIGNCLGLFFCLLFSFILSFPDSVCSFFFYFRYFHQFFFFFPFAPFFYLCHWFNNRLLALWPMSRTFPTKFFLRCDVWRLVALGYRRTRRVELYVNPPFDDWVSFSRDQCKSRSFGLASGNKSKDVRQTITDYSAKGEIMSRISFFIPFFLSFFLS